MPHQSTGVWWLPAVRRPVPLLLPPTVAPWRRHTPVADLPEAAWQLPAGPHACAHWQACGSWSVRHQSAPLPTAGPQGAAGQPALTWLLSQAVCHCSKHAAWACSVAAAVTRRWLPDYCMHASPDQHPAPVARRMQPQRVNPNSHQAHATTVEPQSVNPCTAAKGRLRGCNHPLPPHYSTCYFELPCTYGCTYRCREHEPTLLRRSTSVDHRVIKCMHD
jgi:hypothetical protein